MLVHCGTARIREAVGGKEDFECRSQLGNGAAVCRDQSSRKQGRSQSYLEGFPSVEIPVRFQGSVEIGHFLVNGIRDDA